MLKYLKKEFSSLKFLKFKYKKHPRGFTYVEAIISITLTLISAGAISFGVSKGVRTYKSFHLKERALQELIRYTDEYRMMVAYGERPLPGKQPRNGHKVMLYNPEMEQDGMNWSDPHFVEGTLFHIITDKSNQTAGDQSGYYNIKTWIEWEDKNIGETAFKHIAFEVDQAVLIK